MTKKESLEICRDMWTWLAEDPHYRRKSDYLWEHDLKGMRCDCPCCEFTSQGLAYAIDCTICPLRNYWPEGDLYMRCLNPGSPYAGWEDNIRSKERCLTIVNFCKEELEKMEKENVEESR